MSPDAEHPIDDDDGDDTPHESSDSDSDGIDHGGGIETSVSVDIRGLAVYTHHGVSAAEREIGQRLLIDVSFDIDDCDATITDRIEDTVDYGDVCQQVWLAAQERSYKTLERLCSALCDMLLANFNTDSVTVRATKPQPPIPLAVGNVSVEVWKERSDEDDND